MGADSDEIKGRAKQAAGALTGNEDLENEGKADRKAADAKDKLEHAKDKLHDVIDKAEDKGEEVIDKLKGALHRK